MIRDWQAESPEQEEVVSVRLSTYAKERASADSRLSIRAPGLVMLLRGAAQTADTAVLLGERALYAAQRLPFLARMHARIGSSELFTDLTRNIQSLDASHDQRG